MSKNSHSPLQNLVKEWRLLQQRRTESQMCLEEEGEENTNISEDTKVSEDGREWSDLESLSLSLWDDLSFLLWWRSSASLQVNLRSAISCFTASTLHFHFAFFPPTLSSLELGFSHGEKSMNFSCTCECIGGVMTYYSSFSLIILF